MKYDQIELMCETVVIDQKPSEDDEDQGFKEWDDTMKTARMVRPSELARIKV